MISVVVVNRSRRELLLECVASAYAALEQAGGGEVVVVDNGSDDGSVAALRAAFPAAVVIANEANAGFSPAVCQGIEAARGEHVATLNNDAVLDPAALELLRRELEADPGVGAVAPLMLFAQAPDLVNSAGVSVDRLGIAADRLLGQHRAAAGGEPADVFGASAGAALYRREMLDAIGGFEPAFFAYLEDVDVAWRAAAAGWRTRHVPAALVWHRHSATAHHHSAFKFRLVGRNRVRLLARNATRRQLARGLPAMLAYDLAYVAYAAVRHRSLAPLAGRAAGLRGWRRDRLAGASGRGEVELPRSAGLRGALARDRSWREGGSGG